MNRFGVLNLLVAIGLVASVTAIDCNSRPDFKNAKDCCPHEEFLSSEIAESCKELKNGDENSPHGRKFHMNTCYAECVMNGTGIVNFETMAVDEEKTKSYLAKIMSGKPEFVQVTTDAIAKCAEKGKEIHAMKEKEGKGPPPSPGGCKPCAAMFIHCVEKELTINCPSSAWKNDDTCNNIREFMMVCKPTPRGGRRQ